VLDVNVVPDRNPLFVQVSGGGIRNGYTVRILNKKHETRSFKISVLGLHDPRFSYVGIEGSDPLIEVKPDDVRSVKMYVTIPGEEAAKLPASADISFIVHDTGDVTETKRNTNFRGPG
jgi:polyferredoxin